MSVTIFKDKDCKGSSQSLQGNIADLQGHPVDRPSSIRLSGDTDAVLLFRNDDWHGGALYIRGPRTVTDLGSAKDGGRLGFGNSVRSVRLSPFTVELNVTVVTKGGEMPGIWPDETWARAAIEDAVQRANGFLASKRALLNFEVARITFREDARHYDLSNMESWSFPNAWKEEHEIDVVFVDRFTKDDVGGRAKMPCFGKTVIVAVRANLSGQPDKVLANEDMATILVHEVGHYLGLGHGTADGDQNNIMFDSFAIGSSLAAKELWPDQVRELHDRLANHHARRGDRV